MPAGKELKQEEASEGMEKVTEKGGRGGVKCKKRCQLIEHVQLRDRH